MATSFQHVHSQTGLIDGITVQHDHRDTGPNNHPNGTSRTGTRKPRKSRGRGLRTTTGCAICRKRHMKCDEVKPICGPCSKGDRACVYYNEATVNQSNNDQQPDSPDDEFLRPEHRASIASQHRNSVSSTLSDPSAPLSISIPQQQWPPTPSGEDAIQITSPQSNISNPTYGTEVAPLRWFGLLAGDALNALDLASLDTLGDVAISQSYQPDTQVMTDMSRRQSMQGPPFPDRMSMPSPSKMFQAAISPASMNGSNPDPDERQYWQAKEPVHLRGKEHDIFQRFITGISLWIDLFDPLKHFSTFIPHLALRNEGLMKAVLALGARHLSIKPRNGGDINVDRTLAMQYYYETLQYLQSAMRFTSYKNSYELLATTVLVSTYEMIDGGQGWERHLKGVFWIQRSREINGESGGLEQAVWWAWLRQDVWAAFRENRRCFSFFQPTLLYHQMDVWDMARRVTFLLAQAVNYASDEEKQHGETDLPNRILRANALLGMLEEWHENISLHFEPLPVDGCLNQAFRPIWIHPPAFATCLQMYSMARILLLINQPAAGGYMEYLSRDKMINESIDVIGGIAIMINEDASRLMSTQCLFAAGLYCHDEAKRDCIANLIRDHQSNTGWPNNVELSELLQMEWANHKPG